MDLPARTITRAAIGLFPTALIVLLALKAAMDGYDLQDPKLIYLAVWSLPVTLSSVCGVWLATRKRRIPN